MTNSKLDELHPVSKLVSTDEQSELWPVRILLDSSVHVWSHSGEDLCPKARKARALLAIISLSPDGQITRQRAANLLWSVSEPSVRLARLRDLVHGLKILQGHAWAAVLDVTNDRVGFQPRRVHIEFGLTDETPVLGKQPTIFLDQLEGIDPALDQWLNSLRLNRSRITINSNTSSTQNRGSNLRNTSGQCIVAIPEISVIGLSDPDLLSSLLGQISHGLSRLRWFRTVTRDSYGQVLRVGDQELSRLADYTLVSTLQSSSDTHRLFVELIASSYDLGVVWTGSFEMARDAGRSQIDELTDKLVAQVDAELLTAEVTYNGRHALVHERDAYHLVMRAVPAIYQLEREKFLGVGHYLEQAVEVDPESAFAHSWLAYWYIFLVGQGWARNPKQVMTKAGRAADRAMVLDPRDARGFSIAGHVRAFIGKHLDEAAALHGIALQLNPSLPLALHLSGMTSAYAGCLDEALSRISRCQNLAPADASRFFSEGALAIVHLLRHEHELSAQIGRRVTQRHPNFTSAYKSTISAMGHLGEKAAAQRLVERLRQLEPQFTLRGFQSTAPYRRREDLAHFINGLRLAGVT